MATKEVLKHGESYVPEINDADTSEFGKYETYSRDKIDEKVKNVAVSSGYDWSGRKICFEGDSLTGNATMGYPAYVAEQTDATAVNIAIGGKAVYPNEVGAKCDFRRRVSSIPADVDAIIILGDCNGNILMDASQSYSVDPTEWGGRWNLALDAIKRSFPTVPVILCLEWVGSFNSNHSKHGAEAFWKFSNNHGLIYVNLMIESPLNLRYAASVWGLNDNDQVHTNHEAMPLFADVIIRKLKEIPPFQWTGSDTLTLTTTELTVAAGATAEIEYTIAGDLSIQWTSDNMDVACVMGGVVYGMAAGTATITATTRNGNTATCTVTVTE